MVRICLVMDPEEFVHAFTDFYKAIFTQHPTRALLFTYGYMIMIMITNHHTLYLGRVISPEQERVLGISGSGCEMNSVSTYAFMFLFSIPSTFPLLPLSLVQNINPFGFTNSYPLHLHLLSIFLVEVLSQSHRHKA